MIPRSIPRSIVSGLRFAMLTGLLLLSACAVGPNYKRPALSPSASLGVDLTSSDSTVPADSAPQLVLGMDVPAQWWRVFHSADLDTLVERSLRNNPTIQAAEAAIRAASEQVKAQRGAYFPSVSASVQPSSQHVAGTLSSPLQSNSKVFNLTTSQVSVSYVPDLFGANARAVESLVAQEEEQRFELAAARLTLASNVVLAAIQDAQLRSLMDETRAIILAQQKTLESYQKQFQLGQTSNADLAAQQALLAQTQATLPPLEKQFEINRDLLSSLMGLTPGEPLDVNFEFKSLTLPERLPVSLPLQLIEHRPDVRMAEAELKAASAEVGVAEAARLPNIEIDGAAGGAALGLLPLFNPATYFWNASATLTQPLFQGGTLLHRQRAAEAMYDQAALQYQSTVIGAFQNTADVLHALLIDADALQTAENAETASCRSLDIAQQQLKLGDISQLAVLSAEQAEHQALLTLLQAQAGRYSDVAALFQALGGGWWNSDTSAAPVGDGKAAPRN